MAYGLSICEAMESDSISHKHYYDISMSKRTRKPAKIQDELQNLTPNNEDLNVDNRDRFGSPTTKGFENNEHKSLKQLMNEEEKAETRLGEDEGGRGRNSLGQHFSKEEMNKNLQIVKKQHRDGLQGVKLKKVVGNFLRSLIKGGDKHQLKKPTKNHFHNSQ